MDLGQNIKAARKKAGLTQKQLAEKIGVATITVQQYESGAREPRMGIISKIAATLGVPVSKLVGIQTYDTPAEFDAAWREATKDPGGESGTIVNKADPITKISNAMNRLNEEGQAKAVERVEELTEIPRYRKEFTGHQD